jgi:hypothetical protein
VESHAADVGCRLTAGAAFEPDRTHRVLDRPRPAAFTTNKESIMKKLTLIIAITLAALFALSACERNNDANVASRNLSQAADMFEIRRRVVFYNGITGEYILSIEGLCSLGNQDTSLRMSVTCKTGPNAYKKHFLGLSDNVTFFAQQMETADVSVHHYRVIFKPQSIIPDVDFRGDAGELLRNRN